MTSSRFRIFTLALAASGAACIPGRGPSAPAPMDPSVERAALPAANPRLPAVPDVRGPVRINVVYPKPDQMIEARDSNFVFGSVGSGDVGLRINGTLVPVWPNGSFMGFLSLPPATSPRYQLVAVNGRDSAELILPIKLRPPADTIRRDTIPGDTIQVVTGNVFATLGAPTIAVNDTDRVVIGRPAPGNGQPYKWFLFPGTALRVTGYKADFARLALDGSQEMWIPRSEMQLATDLIPPRRQVGAVRVLSSSDWVDVVVPTGAAPAWLAEQGERSISLTLYGTNAAGTARPSFTDGYVTGVSITPENSRARVTINLNAAPFGYLAFFKNGELTFRVRKPPAIGDARSPLRGLTIAVDPGHPPVGATGPTGLYEAEATLAVGFRVRDILRRRGVNVVMTREDANPVELGLRPIIARRANAHAFVSVHLNAYPDGVNPFLNPGTTTYYFWPHAIALGQSTQAALVPELGLKDIGTKFGNFAVARGTWMPSILCEGLFIILPDQEAAIRTEEYQEAYARGIVRGLETYFASMARNQ